MSEPNCKPLREEGQQLGMEKFAPLFLLYTLSCLLSGIIFVIENIVKPSTSHLQENITKLELLKQELEELKITYEENVDEIEQTCNKSIEITIIIPFN